MIANNVFVSVAHRKCPIGRKRKKQLVQEWIQKGYVKCKNHYSYMHWFYLYKG